MQPGHRRICLIKGSCAQDRMVSPFVKMYHQPVGLNVELPPSVHKLAIEWSGLRFLQAMPLRGQPPGASMRQHAEATSTSTLSRTSLARQSRGKPWTRMPRLSSTPLRPVERVLRSRALASKWWDTKRVGWGCPRPSTATCRRAPVSPRRGVGSSTERTCWSRRWGLSLTARRQAGGGRAGRRRQRAAPPGAESSQTRDRAA